MTPPPPPKKTRDITEYAQINLKKMELIKAWREEEGQREREKVGVKERMGKTVRQKKERKEDKRKCNII